MNTFLHHAMPWTLVIVIADIDVTLATSDNLSNAERMALKEWRNQCQVKLQRIWPADMVLAQLALAVGEEARRRATSPATQRRVNAVRDAG